MSRLSSLTLLLVLSAPVAAAQDVGGVVVDDPFADTRIVLEPQPAPVPAPAPGLRTPLPDPRPAVPEAFPRSEALPPLGAGPPGTALSPVEALGLIVRDRVMEGLGRVLPDAAFRGDRDDFDDDRLEELKELREERREWEKDLREARRERDQDLREARREWQKERRERRREGRGDD